MSDLVDSVKANLEAAQTHLTQAKAHYETAKASYESAKELHRTVVIAHANSVTTHGSQNLCDLCTNIDFQGSFKQRATGLKTSTTRRGIGNLFNAVENQSTCPCCRFLLEACQLGRVAGDIKLLNTSDLRYSTIYLVNDRRPWYNKAGVAADMLWRPYFWLQVGLPTKTGEPHICINLDSPISIDDRDDNAVHSSSPRIRDPIEAFNGSINYEIVQSWLNICDIEHRNMCKTSREEARANINFSLINVHTREIVRASTSERYIALSYVWGKGAQSMYRLEEVDVPVEPFSASEHASSTLKQLQVPYPAPQTIEDAMTFVKRVDQNYLWTDLYCIDQNDSKAKTEQILQMDKIYHSACFTIVALDGEDADWGLPGVSRPLEHTKQPTLNLGIGRLTATYIYSVWDHAGKAVWDSRAWTLQERLLSRRFIIIAKSSISMRCKEEVFHDSMEIGNTTSSESSTPSVLRTPTRLGDEYFWEDGSGIELDETEWDYKQYDALVSVYTDRQLTAQSDALNACRGVLNMISEKTGYQFTFGLPVQDFHRALLWKAHHHNTLTRRVGFPSWSWAGWIGRTEHAYWVVDMADYVDVDAHRPRKRLKGSEAFDPMSDVTAEVLHVQGLETDGSIIRISSDVATFHLSLQREDGEIHTGLKPKSVQPDHAVGDHWTLVAGEAGTHKLRDIAGEHEVFESTDFFFRTDPEQRCTLAEFAVGRRPAEFLLIQRWPSIRDSQTSNKRRENMVSALLINKISDSRYERLASILIPWDEWHAAKPQRQVVELV